jgi:hypothetical protein
MFYSKFLAPHLPLKDRICVTQEFGTRDMITVGRVSGLTCVDGRVLLLIIECFACSPSRTRITLITMALHGR